MDVEEKNKIHKNMSDKLKKYIEAIIEEYGIYIPKDRLDYLKSIKDYDRLIRIYDYGSINGYADNEGINLPLCAEMALKKISKIPGYGINKKHTNYNSDNLVINDNNFVNYLIHVFVSGTDTEKYYEDLLLHETMHFCGSGGAYALKEGINELLTRKIASKNNFITNGCAYPKEVKIAYELQNIFGEEVIDQIAFINSIDDIYLFLKEKLGRDYAELFYVINDTMEEEFYLKYYKDMDSYNGISGVLKKTKNYKKIDYSYVYKLIREFNNKNTPKKKK